MNVEFEGKNYQFPDDATDEEIASFFGQGSHEATSGFVGGDVPLSEVTYSESKKYGRAAAESMGALAGGALGLTTSPFTGPAGPLAGEALGYAAGSKLADVAYGEDTGSIGRKVAEGSLYAVGPAIIARGIGRLGRGAVRSALKIPPTQASKKSAEEAVDTLIRENIRVGEGGIRKGKKIVSEVENHLNDLLSKSSGKVDVNDLELAIKKVKLRDEFTYSSDPGAASSILDEVAELARNHPKVEDGKIPLADAQKLKKQLYKELDNYYKTFQALEPKKGLTTSAEKVGKAAWAEELRNQVMNDPSIPQEAAQQLWREGKILNALRWAQRRANVAANMDPITFNDVLLGSLLREGVPYAIAVRIGRMPSVMSQAGIWMAKAKAAEIPLRTGAIATKNLLSK